MATDIFMNNLGGSSKAPIKANQSTNKVEIGIIDDYSFLVIKKTTAAGVESFYQVALVERV